MNSLGAVCDLVGILGEVAVIVSAGSGSAGPCHIGVSQVAAVDITDHAVVSDQVPAVLKVKDLDLCACRYGTDQGGGGRSTAAEVHVCGNILSRCQSGSGCCENACCHNCADDHISN